LFDTILDLGYDWAFGIYLARVGFNSQTCLGIEKLCSIDYLFFFVVFCLFLLFRRVPCLLALLIYFFCKYFPLEHWIYCFIKILKMMILEVLADVKVVCHWLVEFRILHGLFWMHFCLFCGCELLLPEEKSKRLLFTAYMNDNKLFVLVTY
jgi:hypothetical protein